jgi:hypothetical protein
MPFHHEPLVLSADIQSRDNRLWIRHHMPASHGFLSPFRGRPMDFCPDSGLLYTARLSTGWTNRPLLHRQFLPTDAAALMDAADQHVERSTGGHRQGGSRHSGHSISGAVPNLDAEGKVGGVSVRTATRFGVALDTEGTAGPGTRGS